MQRKPPVNVGLDAEKVAAALVLADGSPTGAARILGVTRNTVKYWIDRSDIIIERKSTVIRREAA